MKKQYKNRKAAHILDDKHEVIKSYAKSKRLTMINAVDDIIESGLRAKKILPPKSAEGKNG
jgi:hypothetical protein